MKLSPHGMILFLCGIAGFFIGITINTAWQDAIEPAQVLSGLVRYPQATPFSEYQTQSWTMLNTLFTIFLQLGFGEWTVCVIMSGIITSLYFQGLGLATFVLTRSAFLAITVPFFARYAVHGMSFADLYPVILRGFHGSYGQWGQAVLLLGLSLVAAGYSRMGSMLMGLLVAFHGVLGAWGIVLLGGAWSWEASRGSVQWRKGAPYLAGGLALSALSYAAHKIQFPLVQAGEAYTALSVIFQWEVWHRRAPHFMKVGWILAALVTMAAVVLLQRKHRMKDEGAQFLLRSLILSGVFGLSLSLVSIFPWYSRTEVSRWILPRIGNLTLLGAFPIWAFLASKGHPVVWLMSLGLSGTELAVGRSFPGWGLAFGIVGGLLTSREGDLGQKWKKFSTAASLVMALVLVGTLTEGAVRVLRVGFQQEEPVQPDPVWDRVRVGKGILLFPLTGAARPQRASRRPILSDAFGSALTALPYQPFLSPMIGPIWSRIYGIDLDQPPMLKDPALSDYAALVAWAKEKEKRAWESHSAEVWTDLSLEFGFTEILAPKSWRLQLPSGFVGQEWILYDVPGPRRPS